MANKDFYNLGYRDAMAYILTIYFEKIKLKYLVEIYLSDTGEKHFAHDWHTA